MRARARSALRRVLMVRRQVWFRLGGAGDVAVPVPQGITCRPYEAGDLPALAALRGPRVADLMRDLADQGHHGMLVLRGEAVVGHAWCAVNDGPAPRLLNGYVRLAPGQAHLHFCYVDPAERGRGLYRVMLLALADSVRRAGAGEVTIDCATDNAASVRGILRAGFVPDRTGTYVSVLGRLVWTRERPATSV